MSYSAVHGYPSMRRSRQALDCRIVALLVRTEAQSQAAPGNPESLELANALQRCASQRFSITRDGALPLPLDAGHPAIECRNKLSQVVDEGLV
jgi:hypothetical protein